MDFASHELALLHSILADEWDRNFHEPGRAGEEETKTLDSIVRKVADEAKQRKLWWAR